EDEASELRRQITDAEPLILPLSGWQLNQWAKESLRHNARNAPKGRSASVLGVGEFVLRYQNSQFQHLVGSLAELEGDHPTDAKGDPDRYCGEHIRVIACTTLGAIISDAHAEIRLNICMPFTLYSLENKERAIANLDNLYFCYINETYHELDIRVGTVIRRGMPPSPALEVLPDAMCRSMRATARPKSLWRKDFN
ncbi:MAG TPA: hypothetical protein VGN34_24855, partial [Ktedonobacteraceae bacterium]